jgi:hypothetical protein
MFEYPCTYYWNGKLWRTNVIATSMEAALTKLKLQNPQWHGFCVFNPDYLEG